MMFRCLLIFTLLTLAPSVESCGAESQPPAQQPREIFPEQPKGMAEQIIAGKFVYNGEVFADLSGGARRGVVFEGLVKLGLGVNLKNSPALKTPSSSST